MKTRYVLMVLLMLAVSFAGLTVPSTSVSQDSFKPGANGVITVSIASSETSEKLITGVNMDIESPPEIYLMGDFFVGDLEPGGSTTASLPFRVDDAAKSTVYNIRIEITGVSDRLEGGYDLFTRRLTIPVTVVDAPILGFATDKQVLNGIEDVSLTVSNNGGPATNLRISIPETSSIALYGKDEVYISESDEQDVIVTLSLDVRNAADGPADMPLNLVYEDEIGIQHSESTKLRMTVRNERLDIVIMQKSDVYTRSEDQLTLEVRNDGDETLEDVRLSFVNSSLRIKEGDEYKFGDIKPGESRSVSMLVFTDMAPGLTLVDTEVEWVEKDLEKKEMKKVPITVTSDADVAVFLEAKPLPLTITQQHTISVLVSNLGSYGIENVDVMFGSPVLKSLDVSNKQYIGGLQRDDFSTVQFQVEVNASTPGTYPAYITINYRDQSGEWKTKQLTQSVMIYDGIAEEETNPLFYLAAVAVLVALVWYFGFRKPKK